MPEREFRGIPSAWSVSRSNYLARKYTEESLTRQITYLLNLLS